MTCTDDTGIIVMNWPVRSPHTNPTEHTWDILSRRARQRQHYTENVIDVLVQELQAISLKGIWCMTRRCQECLNDKGGKTSYL